MVFSICHVEIYIYRSQNTLIEILLLEQFLAMSDQKTEILFHENARLLEFALNWNNPNFFFFYLSPQKVGKDP